MLALYITDEYNHWTDLIKQNIMAGINFINEEEYSRPLKAKSCGYTLLATVPCPDCKGTGIVVGVRIEPRCCGNLNEYGGCCNFPVPDQVAEPEQCERCEATGQVSK